VPGNRYTLRYLDEEATPLFPFGWGLSYTTFDYSDVAVSPARVRPSETVEVSVTVTNAGTRPGQEVVQVYARDPVASRSRPVRELKGFEKIALQPGEARRVTIPVPVESLGFHLEDGTYLVERGRIQFFVGGSSFADRSAAIEVAEELRVAPGERRGSAFRPPP
jgi:beta-glucosidase